MATCLICGTELTGQREIVVLVHDCPRCGSWQLLPPRNVQTWPLQEQLRQTGNEAIRRANLSHKVRRMGRDGAHVGIPLDNLGDWGLDAPLPKPIEQANELVVWLGDRLPTAAHHFPAEDLFLAAWLGTAINQDDPAVGLKWLLNQEPIKRLIIAQPSGGSRLYKLTWEGWARYEELKRNDPDTRTAFMAMQFGDRELDAVVSECFSPAVSATGFNLRRLNEGQAAGSIDDQLRVALRTSRFVIADLSHNNRGAYWEAGYAEGLGKPVIYTCNRSVWENEPVHFDTSHLVTVIWDPSDLEDAGTKLKATIRATLPLTAKLFD